MLTVSYFSAGVSSAVATKLMIDEIDRIMYTHIDDQHPDTMRFVRDCEQWFGKPVEVMQSHYRSVDTVCRARRFISSPHGAVCTTHLKRDIRKEFERQNRGLMRIVWGYDATEKDRVARIEQSMPNHHHCFPLVERGIGKQEAHEILRASGIARPMMYWGITTTIAWVASRRKKATGTRSALTSRRCSRAAANLNATLAGRSFRMYTWTNWTRVLGGMTRPSPTSVDFSANL